MAAWDSLWRRCIGQRVFALALVCFFLQMLTLVTVYLVSRSWTHIKYAWYAWRHLILPRRHDFRKDAYVVYAEGDTEFVFNKLGPCLERFGVRLLLRHIEDLPGSIIAENIVKNTEDSWKVLLVVTRAFSQCDWSCSFSVQQAQRSISDTLPDRVLVLFLQDLHTLPPMASLELLLRNYPERNVFHAHRDLPERHAAWEALASAILRERN
ncbi:toll-like receptor 6 [Littorina saxatilis]|uniref:TIR domain-containing protein n=1 Tax=Littorina saxatilis TaxID=31220 RepID=A0AAN9GHI6_9CAEN